MKTQNFSPLYDLDKTLAFVGLLFGLILTIWLAVTSGHPIYVAASILTFGA